MPPTRRGTSATTMPVPVCRRNPTPVPLAASGTSGTSGTWARVRPGPRTGSHHSLGGDEAGRVLRGVMEGFPLELSMPVCPTRDRERLVRQEGWPGRCRGGARPALASARTGGPCGLRLAAVALWGACGGATATAKEEGESERRVSSSLAQVGRARRCRPFSELVLGHAGLFDTGRGEGRGRESTGAEEDGARTLERVSGCRTRTCAETSVSSIGLPDKGRGGSRGEECAARTRTCSAQNRLVGRSAFDGAGISGTSRRGSRRVKDANCSMHFIGG